MEMEADKFDDQAVRAVFLDYPEPVQSKLLEVRAMIFDMAARTAGVGPIEETLKWGQPSYLTPATRSGSTIRIDQIKNAPGKFGIYFHCQTSLVDSFRSQYSDQLRFEGNRSIVLDAAEPLPESALRHCIAMALTYHLRKRRGNADPIPALAG